MTSADELGVYITALETLNLSPDETLVVHVNTRQISAAERDGITQGIRAVTGHRRVLVVDESAELSVLTPDAVDDDTIEAIAQGLARRTRRLGLKIPGWLG